MPLKKNKESKAAEILMEEQSEVINPPKNKKCPKLSGRRQRKPRGDKLGTLELCDDGFATDEEEETNNGEYESCHHFQIQETTVHDHEQKEHTNLRKKRKEHLKNVEVNMEVDNHISQNDNSGKVELVKGETLNIHEEDKKQHTKGRVTKKKTADNPAKEEVSSLNMAVEPVVVIENTANVEKVEDTAVNQQGTRTSGRTRKGQNMEMNSTKEKTDDSKPKSNKRTLKKNDEGKDQNAGPNLPEKNPREMEQVKEESSNNDIEEKKQHSGKGRQTKKKMADCPDKVQISSLNVKVEPVVENERRAKVKNVEDAEANQKETRTTGRKRKGQTMEEMNVCSTKEEIADSKSKSSKGTQEVNDEGKDENVGLNVQEKHPGEVERVKVKSSNNDIEEQKQHSGKGRQTKKKTADNPDKVHISSLNVEVEPVVENESKDNVTNVENAAANQQEIRKTTGRTRKGQNLEETNICSTKKETTDGKPKSNKRTQKKNDEETDKNAGLNLLEGNHGKKVNAEPLDIEEKKQHSGKGREIKKKRADSPKKVQISSSKLEEEPVLENESKDIVEKVEDATTNQQETSKTTSRTRKGQNTEEMNICNKKEKTQDSKPKSNKRTQKINNEEKDETTGSNLQEQNPGEIEQVKEESLNFDVEEKKHNFGKGREARKKIAKSPEKRQMSSLNVEVEPVVENGSKANVKNVKDAAVNQQETRTTGRKRKGQNLEEEGLKEEMAESKPKSNKRTQKRNTGGKEENAGQNLSEENLKKIDPAKTETLNIEETKQHSDKGGETKKKTAGSPENVHISSLKVEVLLEPLKNGSKDKVEKIEDAAANQQETRTGRTRKGQTMEEMNVCSTKEEMTDSKPKSNKRTHKKNNEGKDENAWSNLQEGNPEEIEPVKEESLKIDEEQREAKKKIADSPEKEEVSRLNVEVEPVVENRSKENIDDATANQQEGRKTTGRKRKGPNMEEMKTLSTKEETTDPKPNKRTLKIKDEEKDENQTSKSGSVTKPTSEISHGDTCEKFVGAHVSIAGGLYCSVLEAADMKAKAFGLFLKSQRKWECKPLDENDAIKFKETCQEYGFLPDHILPHGSYLMNCGSPDENTLQKSREALVDELQRCEMLGLTLFNFHPGSSCGKISTEKCLENIAESINYAHSKTHTVVTVIENMCCQGHTVGGKFEELKSIIDKVTDKSRIGVCLDTCHAFAAGYDLSTEDGFQKTISEFDKIIGFEYLKGMHINDSKSELGCHLDRHENIGKGKIGKEGFRRIMNCPQLNNIPMILETPCSENNTYAKEVEILYGMCNT